MNDDIDRLIVNHLLLAPPRWRIGDKVARLRRPKASALKRTPNAVDVENGRERIIVACCVLHNFGYLNYDHWDDYTEIDQEEADAEDFRQMEENNDEAIVKRYDITQQLSRLR
ncbi:hypothetical protein JTB14_004408 [Gonioctena quinquepunctata]|nr:hypothetical protein JTB14_004408 [Gonioctena quinquepunctata]